MLLKLLFFCKSTTFSALYQIISGNYPPICFFYKVLGIVITYMTLFLSSLLLYEREHLCQLLLETISITRTLINDVTFRRDKEEMRNTKYTISCLYFRSLFFIIPLMPCNLIINTFHPMPSSINRNCNYLQLVRILAINLIVWK